MDEAVFGKAAFGNEKTRLVCDSPEGGCISVPSSILMSDEAMAVCAEPCATLILQGGEGEPEDVSSLICVRPDSMRSLHRQQAWRDGVWKDRPPYLLPFRHSIWEIGSKKHVESRENRCHIDWLLERVKGKGREFQALEEGGWSARIAVFWPIVKWNEGVEFEPASMGVMAGLGISLWLDIYADASEEDQPSGALPDNPK